MAQEQLNLIKVYEDHENDLTIIRSRMYLTKQTEMNRSHLHTEFEVVFVPSEVDYCTNLGGTVVRGKGPAVIIVAPYILHFTYYTAIYAENLKHTVFYVGDEYFRLFGHSVVSPGEIIGDHNGCIFSLDENSEKVQELFRLINFSEFGESTKRSGENLATPDQKLVFGLLMNYLNTQKDQATFYAFTSKSSYISDVIRYLANHIEEKKTTKEVADHFFVSRDKLNRDFYNYTQTKLGKFMVELQLNRAKALLRRTDYSIQKIAELCGFDNDISFYPFFKKQTGMTPREFAQLP